MQQFFKRLIFKKFIDVIIFSSRGIFRTLSNINCFCQNFCLYMWSFVMVSYRIVRVSGSKKFQFFGKFSARTKWMFPTVYRVFCFIITLFPLISAAL